MACCCRVCCENRPGALCACFTADIYSDPEHDGLEGICSTQSFPVCIGLDKDTPFETEDSVCWYMPTDKYGASTASPAEDNYTIHPLAVPPYFDCPTPGDCGDGIPDQVGFCVGHSACAVTLYNPQPDAEGHYSPTQMCFGAAICCSKETGGYVMTLTGGDGFRLFSAVIGLRVVTCDPLRLEADDAEFIPTNDGYAAGYSSWRIRNIVVTGGGCA